MYPDFQFLINEWFGINLPVLSLLKTFGFLVAMSFLAAGYALFLELKRKEEDGILPYTIDEITVGQPPSIINYVTTAIIFFLVGFKVVGLVQDLELSTRDPLSYIFSTQGNLIAGVLLSLAVLAYTYFSNRENYKKEPTTKRVKTYPSTRVGDMAVLAAVTGFGGAKLFNTFEDWDQFLIDPFGSLFSSMGLTFYGGLIMATIAFYFYARKYKIDFRHLCDAAAPGLILAYGIGRLGCMVAGDGDWGVYNSAFKLDENQKVVSAEKGEFDKIVKNNPSHFARMQKEYKKVPNVYFNSSILPVWFQAYTYPNNVAREGVVMPDQPEPYNRQLASPVFPTPLYEFLASVLIFSILWLRRRSWKVPLTVFSVYLMFNGLERFLVERIRVNAEYSNGMSQAEIIGLGIILFGIILFFLRKKIDSAIRSKAVTAS